MEGCEEAPTWSSHFTEPPRCKQSWVYRRVVDVLGYSSMQPSTPDRNPASSLSLPLLRADSHWVLSLSSGWSYSD